MIRKIVVRLINKGGNLIAEVSCQYHDLRIEGITIFQNGDKGFEVSWPKQRPKGNYSKWTPIVIPSEKLKGEADPLILTAVQDAIGEIHA